MKVYKKPETDFIQNKLLSKFWPLDLSFFSEVVIKDVCFFITPAHQKTKSHVTNMAMNFHFFSNVVNLRPEMEELWKEDLPCLASEKLKNRKWKHIHWQSAHSQCPRTDINKRSLPRPTTTTAWKLIPHRSSISKNWNTPRQLSKIAALLEPKFLKRPYF